MLSRNILYLPIPTWGQIGFALRRNHFPLGRNRFRPGAESFSPWGGSVFALGRNRFRPGAESQAGKISAWAGKISAWAGIDFALGWNSACSKIRFRPASPLGWNRFRPGLEFHRLQDPFSPCLPPGLELIRPRPESFQPAFSPQGGVATIPPPPSERGKLARLPDQTRHTNSPLTRNKAVR
jgi:hypothetical protein